MFHYLLSKTIRFIELLMSVVLCLISIWLGEAFGFYKISEIVSDYPITLPIIGGVLTSYILPLVKSILSDSSLICDCEKRRKM